MSHELVPTAYDRFAFNTLYGMETRPHDGNLTTQEAEAINNNFEIYVVPVRHGFGRERNPSALEEGVAPGNDDYEHSKRIVDCMTPDDMLFIEGVGFNSEDDTPLLLPDPSVVGLAKHLYSGGSLDEAGYAALCDANRELWDCRDSYWIDTIEYVKEYALLGGIPVVLADMDVYENARLGAILDEQGRQPEGPPMDERLFDEANTIRERRAIYTVKDRALELLKQPSANGHRRRLFLLYGAHHAEALQEGFHTMGLECQVITRLQDDPVRRHDTFMDYLAAAGADIA